ncbi:MAG: acetoacetyl-CoA reductase [Gammaproteobacteria bacterium]|nr:acetoacetyl-CoA reductase [Gammaproteobacteria bacterium]
MKQPVALVTGGIGGLGTAICEELAQQGLRVYANYLPDLEETAHQWQQTLAQHNIHCGILKGDVTSEASVADMVDTLHQKHDSVAVLVNNAGITRDATLKNLSHQDWYSVIDTNLSSLYRVTKPLLEPMLKVGSGRIINISSVSAQQGQFGQTNYAAAKAGVHGFTKALAKEVAAKGITVNTVSPGFVDTEMVKTIPTEVRTELLSKIPVGRMAQPVEIAKAVAYLASEHAGYVTGSELSINGGLHMF